MGPMGITCHNSTLLESAFTLKQIKNPFFTMVLAKYRELETMMVELKRLELSTSCLQSRRSSR